MSLPFGLLMRPDFRAYAFFMELGEDGFYHPTDEEVDRIMRRVAHHRYDSNDKPGDAEGCNKCGLTKEYHLHSL